MLAIFGLGVAKPTDQLIDRADKTIEKLDSLRLQVVTKDDLRAIRRVQALARRR